MSRPIVLSNGELHVGLNDFATVHDFYYPYVGYVNHCAGGNLRHKVGVWIDGDLSWIDNPKNPINEWVFTFSYPHGALIGHTVARNDRLGIILEFDDFVDAHMSVFVRNIHVVNLRPEAREVRLFMHQAFVIGDSRSNTDTAQYLPSNDAILHYRGHKAFIISGEFDKHPFDEYTVGLFGIEGKEGTFRDAEDGKLEGNNVEHGRVDSTIMFKVPIDAHSSQRVNYWIAAGKSTREALYIHKQMKEEGIASRGSKTASWWHTWAKPALDIVDKIHPDHQKRFLESVMIMKSQIDKRGAIIASTDTSMLNYSRDAYAYCWPRDGAYTLWPLIRMGFTDEAHLFFQFMKRGMHSDGYMMHKYRADGALGSSWHPYVHGDIISPPIQEDETALPLFIFAQFYEINKDEKLLKEFYEDMIVPMSNFLTDFVDKTTGLPKPSYDLWEQTFLTSTYTTGVTFAALIAASDLATAANDPDNAVKWRSAANDIQEAAHKHLYNGTKKVFRRGLNVVNGNIVYDDVVDCASVFGAYNFGLFEANSLEMLASIESIIHIFRVNDGAPGLPRYENDDYRRTNRNVTGNLWYISSLWLAQYYIDKGDKDKACKILDWVKSNSSSTGVMGEQFDPSLNSTVSPAPLTWTHAEYIATLLDLATADNQSQ